MIFYSEETGEDNAEASFITGMSLSKNVLWYKSDHQFGAPEGSNTKKKKETLTKMLEALRAIFSECRESEDSHEKSIFLLFRQNIPLGELIQGKIV